ncbi:MAG TPA: zinc-dependent alcohol dehydrogenase family protein [Roseomonas sp.]|nr:zinc-dependent alcohol dehydrogenase family protein [Roseomonas sp.]
MRAFVLDRPGTMLRCAAMADPHAGPGQLLIRVSACAVCRTDLHVVDGELSGTKMPIIPGHEIVGHVEAVGPGTSRFRVGERVGVPWLGFACGTCGFCRSGRENLCPEARFTGYHIDGGYAELTVADERFCFALPDAYGDAEAAPLLCAGLIGYRALRMAGDARRLGIYGFGAAAHIVTQLAIHEGRKVFAFVRPGDRRAADFALEQGATWAGPSDAPAPELMDAAILFAPVGALVPAALRAVERGGTVVCAGIHMSEIPAFPYESLWQERCVRSVANLTRSDGTEFLDLAPRVPVQTTVETLPLNEANRALARLRAGDVAGALVLTP